MKNIILYIVILLLMLLQSCGEPYSIKPSSIKPYVYIEYHNTIQGKITKGSFIITQESESGEFIPATDGKIQGIVIKNAHNRFIQKFIEAVDIYTQKTYKTYRNLSKSNEKQFLYIPQSFTDKINLSFEISNDFEGAIHVFINMKGKYWYKRGNLSNLYLTYGKALATELKAQGITDMDYRESTRAPLYPIGEKERIFITESSKPEKIRALMQAAKAVKDPRLLVIKRASSTGKVSITAFGETTQIDAGTTYMWQFNQEQRENLRQFIVKRKH